MKIGLLKVSLYIPGASSLKDKRQVLHSMFSRLKNKFNIALAEVEAQDLHQRCELGIVSINTSQQELQRTLDYVLAFIENNPDSQLMQVETEYL
jgi:uncharacterized protein